MKKVIYEHYGSDSFDKSKFVKVKNKELLSKPIGGFWGCRKGSGRGWKEWCIANDFELDRLSTKFDFCLSDNARVFIIDSEKKLNQLSSIDDGKFTSIWKCLDFEKISSEYDAIEVLISKCPKLYWDLYGWDFDSILVLNPNVIIENRNIS